MIDPQYYYMVLSPPLVNRFPSAQPRHHALLLRATAPCCAHLPACHCPFALLTTFNAALSFLFTAIHRGGYDDDVCFSPSLTRRAYRADNNNV